MAQVPTLESATVTPQGVPTGFENIQAPAGAFGAGIAAAGSNLGRDISQFGESMNKIALENQQLKNQADANTQFLDVDGKMSQVMADYKSLRGQAAVDAMPGTIQKLQDLRKQALSSAGNPTVANMMDQSLTRRLGYSIMDVSSHGATELRTYNTQANVSRIANSVNDVALDPSEKNFQIQRQTAIDHLNDELGKEVDPATLKAKTNAVVGDLWTKRIESVAMHDPQQAQLLLGRAQASGEIDAAHLEQIQRLVKQSIDTVAPKQISDNVKNGIGGFDINAARTAITANESGQRGYDFVGPKTVRKSGVVDYPIGRYQIMASNVPQWSQQYLGYAMTPEELQKNPKAQDLIFEKKFTADAQKYGPAGAAAVWFSGSPTIDSKQTDVLGTSVSRYVANFMAGYKKAGGGTGTTSSGPLTATTDEGTLGKMISEGRSIAKQQYPGNPEVADAVDRNLRSEFTLIQAQKRDVNQQNETAIYSAVLGDETHKPITDVNDLIGPGADPNMRQAWWNLPPEKRATIQDRILKQAKGIDVPMTPERQNRVNELMGLSQNDPQKFIATNMLAEDLPHDQIKSLMTAQHNIYKDAGKPVTNAKAMSIANPILEAAGMGKPTKDDTAGWARYNQFTGALSEEIQNWQAAHKGQIIQEKDIQSLTSQLIRQQAATGLSRINPFSSSSYEFEKPTGERRVIPPADLGQINAAYKKLKGRAPTDQEAWDLYQQGQAVLAKQAKR